jgi:conjugal transfer pilus assembly protein TraW
MAICKPLLILGLLVASPVYANSNAKNLGNVGTVYQIVEPDLAEEVKAKVDTEKLAKFMAEQRKNYQPKDIHALPTARADRTFLVDMTYTLDHDIPGENGEIMYKRGLTWNPLDYVSPHDMVVINGEDAKHLEWFEKSLYYKNLKTRLLISAGYAAPLKTQLNRPVFYLTKVIADRLQLSAAPCIITTIVTQEGSKKMMVQEVKIDK